MRRDGVEVQVEVGAETQAEASAEAKTEEFWLFRLTVSDTPARCSS